MHVHIGMRNVTTNKFSFLIPVQNTHKQIQIISQTRILENKN